MKIGIPHHVGPVPVWQLRVHLEFFHGIYTGDIKQGKRGEKKLIEAHVWAHGEGGQIRVPHEH